MTWSIFLMGLSLVLFGAALGGALAAVFMRGADDDPDDYQPPIQIEDYGNIRLIRPRKKRARIVKPQAW